MPIIVILAIIIFVAMIVVLVLLWKMAKQPPSGDISVSAFTDPILKFLARSLNDIQKYREKKD